MLPALYPPAVQRPVSYAAAAGPLDQQPRGWALHVVVGFGSPWGTFEHAPAGSRRFSHLWVSKAGAVEQYAPLTGKSWAMAAGNPWWWSVETEGVPGEPLTDQQLAALAAWHVWCGADDIVAGPIAAASAAPGRGIVTHQDGGRAWGGHACPGPIRAGQRTEILRRAAALRQGGTVAGKFTREDLAPAWAVTWGDESAADRLAAAAHGSALLPVLSHLVDQVTALSTQVTTLQKQVTALTLKS